ncbi:MAG: PAC2 family protein [candidate division WOR-3 bacterium]
MPIRYYSTKRVQAPILIACWPGMGHVGILAASYLRVKLKGEPYAEIDATPYFLPDAIEVENGIGRIPLPPRQQVFYVSEPPLLVFEGEAQISGEPGMKIASELLDIAQESGVGTVFTGAAFALPMSYRQAPKVYGVATDEILRQRFISLGIEPLSEGRISGLNGLLLGLAKSRSIPAASFLATMPQYAIEAPNPKASKAVIEVFCKILNTSVDMTDLDERIKEADRMMGEFERRVAAALEALRQQAESRLEQEPGEQPETGEAPEPHELMAHIERLFEEAQRDISKAKELKEELDRWGLFKLYEDRFLDLFDKRRKKD